jgi:hypothetical protein
LSSFFKAGARTTEKKEGKRRKDGEECVEKEVKSLLDSDGIGQLPDKGTGTGKQ